MEDVNVLLSEEFVEYSKKIAVIVDAKKKCKEEVEQAYDKYKKELKVLESKAEELTKEFDKWKTSVTAQSGEKDEDESKK